ncbi:MAG: hypothetical protein H6926_00440 [Chromatiales bacterium]|nr:hypothetical protein [Gammaproteobacteria bacterium]MCP5351647.1 hypothetical protein [Chromatiales bacterium]
MSLPHNMPLLLILSLTLTGFGMGSLAAAADEGDTSTPATSRASMPASSPAARPPLMQPMQVLVPPMWQPRPPAWYQPELMWRQRQPEAAPPREAEESPARSHWQRHAPEWMTLPPARSRTTMWKPQSLTPAAVDSIVAPVNVPPPEDAIEAN